MLVRSRRRAEANIIVRRRHPPRYLGGYILSSHKFLQTMIERIRHVKISVPIQRNRPRIIELPRLAARATDDLHRLAIHIKHLDATVPKLTDKNVPRLVHRDVVGITQLTRLRPRATELPQKPPIRREHLNPMIARIRHIKPILCINANAFRAIELTRGGARPANDLK
jgi:hypothetical protein